MSSSGSKPGFKEIIVEHGEKFILGAAGLFVLVGIGTTQWSTYERKPEEFSQKIDTGKTAFVASTWPDSEKETFVAGDPGDEVARLLAGLPSSLTYEYTVKWVHRLTKAREKVGEPDYLPIESLVADPGRLLIELSPEKSDSSAVDVRIASADELDGTKPAGPASATLDGPRNTISGVDAPRPGRNRNTNTGGPSTDAAYITEAAGEGMGDYADSSYGGADRNVEARGTRFAAIRGIFRMKQQVEKVQRALRLDTPQEAYQQVQFWDFELQRQTAVAGPNPWPKEWEDVDIEVAVNLLDRVEFDVDVVDEQYRDAIFTMPLPYRVTGSWARSAGPNGPLASHPQIKRLLTEKEQLEQETRAKALLKAAEREKKIKEAAGKGFQRVQVNTRSMRGSMMGNSDAMSAYNESYDELSTADDPEMAGNGTQSSGYPGRAMGRMDVVATPELLLFRYLDFSVVPGNAYRYRVRLKLLNPNFDRDPGELQDFASREGKYRESPWSEVSTVALIQDENEVYVEKVDERRGVSMDAYQWMSDTGSYVHAPFEGLERAERIASMTREVKSRRRDADIEIQGGITTEVLRPSEQTFAEEQIDFVTPNTLVDYTKETLLNPEEFPELELATKRIPSSLQEVVVVNRFGDLVHLDTVANAASHERADNRMARQDELWTHLKQTVTAPGEAGDISDLLGGESSEYPGGMSIPGAGSSPPRRRRSSLKRNSAMMMPGSSGPE